MTIAADRKSDTSFLEGLPAFASCTRGELEEFVTHGVVKLHCMAGEELSSSTDQEQNLYVLAAGSALLHAGDGVAVALEPGDYFGHSPERRRHMTPTVVAVSNVEVLVINTHEAARIGHTPAAGRSRVKGDHQIKFPSLSRRNASVGRLGALSN
jgi:CRP-like cAMP-binding protein